MATAQSPDTPLVHLLHLMSTRMTWRSGKRLLEEAGLHASRGWEETIATLKSLPPPEAHVANALNVLGTAFAWQTFVGNKEVTWYDFQALDPQVRGQVRNWAETVDGNGLVQRYGTPMNRTAAPYLQDALLPLVGTRPRLISADRVGGKLYLQYFSARSYSLRESLDVSDWPQDQRQRVERYHEVVGVKLTCVPCFDTIVVDLAADRLELRIDYAQGFRNESKALGVAYLLEELNRLTFAEFAQQPAGFGMQNFFGAVQRIYQDAAAGRVSVLGFVATSDDTSSNNQGRTLRNANQDLRSDKFHAGGCGAVQRVQAYTIGTAWTRGPQWDPLEIELRGNVKMIYGMNPSISVATLSGCKDGDDFDFLSQQLKAHLQ